MNFENYPNNNQIFYEPKNASKAIYFQNQNESPNTMYYNAYNNNTNFNYPIDVEYEYKNSKKRKKKSKYIQEINEEVESV